MKPIPTTKLDVTMGFSPRRIDEFMSPMASIPAEFRRDSTPWVQFANDWFFRGLASFERDARDGIDPNVAFGHLGAVLRSWTPRHEHKTACVAYLASLWFTRIRWVPAGDGQIAKEAP